MTYNRGAKLALYARFGAPEVRIVAILGAAVELFGQPKEVAYSSQERRTSGALVRGLVPGVAIHIAALLA